MMPMGLLDFKSRVMKWECYKSIEPPTTAQINYPRDLEVPGNADYHDYYCAESLCGS